MLITIVPVAPLRSQPSHRSEMVSQLLFGETVELLETDGDFCKVKAAYDGYEGWCQTSQLTAEPAGASADTVLAGEWSNRITINGQPATISFGSTLSFLQNNRAEINQYYMEYEGSLFNPKNKLWSAESLLDTAFPFLNTPYLWGGKSVFGIDCSGFTQLVFKCFNIYLHRDAYQQATQGDAIGFLQEAQPGDLAFFDNAEGKITHVGILINDTTIIHASGRVRIDTIDNMGIVNSETGKRTHALRIVKRMVR